MNILITGANGFLGKKVTKKLLDDGHYVRALVIPEEDCTYLAGFGTSIDIVRGDLTKPETLKGVMHDIEVVIHLAAILNCPDEKLNMLINFEGTKNIADLAEKAGVERFVFTSSMTATSPKPNAYGLSKKLAEEHLRKKKFLSVIIRPTLLYGKEGITFQKLVGMINMFPFVVPVIGSGKANKQPIYIEDAAELLTKAALVPLKQSKVYQIGGPDAVPFTKYVKMILKAQGKKKLLVHAPKWVVWPMLTIAEMITKNLPITREGILELETSTEVDADVLERDFRMKLTPLELGIKKSL